MTENLLKEAKKDFEKRLKEKYEHVSKTTRADLLKDFEEIVRDYFPVGTLPSSGFPVGLIHKDDYYGETLAPKLQLDQTFGWNGEV